MIRGELSLREVYPDFDEKQYQPAGIDLKLDKVMSLETSNSIYGLCEDIKQLPVQKELSVNAVMIGGTMRQGFTLEPGKPYIGVTKEKIKIDECAGQFYLPRSSLLRAGIDVRTAFGDPGFHGHLSFLLLNHTDTDFFIEKGARFAQLIDMNVHSHGAQYDGDYNEE